MKILDERTPGQLIFGDNLNKAVVWIVGEACQTDTPEAYTSAAQQLKGIHRLLLVWDVSISAELAVSKLMEKLKSKGEQ